MTPPRNYTIYCTKHGQVRGSYLTTQRIDKREYPIYTCPRCGEAHFGKSLDDKIQLNLEGQNDKK